MSWMISCYETYENLKAAGVNALMPIAHSTQRAHVEVTIDIDGDFVSADYVAISQSDTLIPVTEASASRSGASVFPHPLCDKLQYVAGDYKHYVRAKAVDFYGAYIEQLKAWNESAYSTPKIDAIYKYISKKNIIGDLIQARIFSVDENGLLTEKWENCGIKLTTGNQDSAFIRFRVSGDGHISAVWQDKKIQQRWGDYYISNAPNREFCYATGENTMCATSFPKKIMPSAADAKLISSNDTSGFTYRGRFANACEAVNIGFDVSQKAHNALKYLIANQGELAGNRMFVLWGTKGEDTPGLNKNTDELSDDEDASVLGDTKKDCAERLSKAINGYKENLDFSSKLILMGLEAATTGRMAMVSYSEYTEAQALELIDRIKQWHSVGAWRHTYKPKNSDKQKVYYGIPSLAGIVTSAYGTNQNGMLKVSNDKLFGSAVSRLMDCITKGAKIPRDIVNILLRKSSQPQNYDNFFQWGKVVVATCSMYIKYLHDYEGETTDMNIDDNSVSTDYILGRILAIMHSIELWDLLDKTDGKIGKRTTNAMRYFTKFMSDPCNTYKVIRSNVQPYMNSLGAKGSKLYSLLDELSAKIDAEEFAKMRNLDGRFILGFDSQLQTPPCKRAEEALNENETKEI